MKGNSPRGQLITGKPSLSRMHCRKCNEESIHRWGVCVHCGTEAPTKEPPRGRPLGGPIRFKRAL